MNPLSQWPLAARARIAGVLTDIDDTLTTDGVLAPSTRQALCDLQAAGLPVFAITGRPAGRCETFALDWPVQAIVAESGAVALWRGNGGALQKSYLQDGPTRQAHFIRLQAVAQTVLAQVPNARLATDSAGRETDIAIDHSEHHHLDATDIERVVALMRANGLNATVSSIHINGWLGGHDKFQGARWIVREQLGRDLDAERERWVCVGDSANDVRLFEQLPHSVGVANIASVIEQLAHRPRYVTLGARGDGFAEVAQAVLQARRPAMPAP